MPKAIVRGNARALPKAIKSTPAAKTRSDITQLDQVRANWQAVVAECDAASQRYSAMCNEMESAARAAAAERSESLKKIYAEEDKLAVVMDKQDEAASAILAAPASIETLHLKLEVFSHLWAKERGVDAALNGGDVSDVAAGIVLDLISLLRRGEGTRPRQGGLSADTITQAPGRPGGRPFLCAARLSRSAIAYVAEAREAEKHHRPG